MVRNTIRKIVRPNHPMTQSGDPRPLMPLREIRIDSVVGGGLARTVLRQRYENTGDRPMEVVYKTPLPSDGAVAGYAFDVGGRRIEGEVRSRQEARRAYDEALMEGRTAALLDEERDDLFTLRLGAVPPGAEIVAELTIDHPVSWRPGEGWEWRFPTTLVPRFLGEPGRVDDGARLQFPVEEAGTGVLARAILHIEDELSAGDTPGSPSHTLTTARAGAGWEVELPEGAPDRDFVVRWNPALGDAPGVRLETIRRDGDGSSFALLTIVPPAPDRAAAATLPRDLIVLLDTSGSMMGEPLAQAKRVVGGLVDGLADGDRLELLAFAWDVERWDPEVEDAHAWLAARTAGGGTEMASAVIEALRPLRKGVQRQVVLLTDGHVGFEEEVVRQVHEGLPEGSRLHCVGVGSAVNRTLTRHASRAGRGREVLVGLGEDGERAARVVDASTRAPVLTNLQVAGEPVESVAPAAAPDVLAGEPARLYVRLSPEGGPIRVTGVTVDGPWESILDAPPCPDATGRPAIAGAFGRERVADLELGRVAGDDPADVDAAIEALGLDLGLSTRLTSWVAADDSVSVEPEAELQLAVVPHELAFGVSAEGLGLRSVSIAASAPRRRRALRRMAPMAKKDVIKGQAPAPSMMNALPPEPPDALMDDLEAEEESEATFGHVKFDFSDPEPWELSEEPSPPRVLDVSEGQLVLRLHADLVVGDIVELRLVGGGVRRVKVVKELDHAWLLDAPDSLLLRVLEVRVRGEVLWRS